MKVAVVAILRDEASDILSWLGWYIALGVDTFILFDDGSLDGTRDLLCDAAFLHDIRIYGIENTSGPHLERQRLTYITALNGLAEGFDWVGFFDADEYLSLERHDTIQAYLSSFSDEIGAIGINWCNHGSNGHVTKPASPPFHAFTRHYENGNFINRHVKSFIRPAHWSGSWVNVHFLEPRDSRYVNADGDDISWWHTKGITDAPPVWGTARILHYQLRSMEHFAERARRRFDVTLTPNDFIQADHNDVENLEPQKRTGTVLGWTRRAVYQGVARVLNNILPADDLRPAPHPPTLELFSVTPAEGGHLVVSNGWIRVMPESHEEQSLFALQISSVPDRVFLFMGDAQGNLLDSLIEEDNRLLGVYPYIMMHTSQPEHVAFAQSDRQTFLTATPPHLGGSMIANRRSIDTWELFSLTAADQSQVARNVLHGPTLRYLTAALATTVTLDSVSRLARTDILQTLRCLPVLLSCMAQADAHILENALGPLRPCTV